MVDNVGEGTLKDFFLTGYVWNFGIMLLNIFLHCKIKIFLSPHRKEFSIVSLVSLKLCIIFLHNLVKRDCSWTNVKLNSVT